MKADTWSRTKDYVLIIIIFAVTGTTAAIFPRWIMPITGFAKGTWQYWTAYVLLITPIYQVLLLGYAFIFGKFHYFYDKQKKLLRWLLGRARKEN
ncbi:MAG: DUF6787 family protein [Bacteroidia bacterium]|nr:DUF6787 family protein [Bacteroidia bacterium]